MEAITCNTRRASPDSANHDVERAKPFSRQWVRISKEEHIGLIHRANYWEAQYTELKQKFTKQGEEIQHKNAKIKDLQNRLFGKKSEKPGSARSEKEDNPSCGRKRGQQPGSVGHGRTPHPDLPVVLEVRDLAEDKKRCPRCGLSYLPTPALDEHTEFIEVQVNAYKRRIHRPVYVRHPRCCCAGTVAVLSAPPAPRLISRSPYQVSFWVEVLLSKFRYAQPTQRYLRDLGDQALEVSAGSVAGGLQAIAPLFEPIMAALHQKADERNPVSQRRDALGGVRRARWQGR